MRIWLTVWLLLMFTGGSGAAESQKMPAGNGLLTGQVMMAGKPMPNATIAIFVVGNGPPPDLGSSRRVPEGTFRAEGGRFKIALPPGRYYMGVAARLDPNRKGPPGDDEKFFFVRDKRGELRQFEVVAKKTVKLGRISGTAPESFPEIGNAFLVEGIIYDDEGKPLKGALVLVRGNPAVPRPLFISPRTGADGKYHLTLPADANYYLVVREDLANIGRPVKGTLVGAYVRGSAPDNAKTPMLSTGDPVTGSAGQVLKGMDIKMRLVPNPEEVKDGLQKKAETSLSPEKSEDVPLVPGKIEEIPLLPVPAAP